MPEVASRQYDKYSMTKVQMFYRWHCSIAEIKLNGGFMNKLEIHEIMVGEWWKWLEIILIKHGKCALHILEDLHILSLNDWLANNQTKNGVRKNDWTLRQYVNVL